MNKRIIFTETTLKLIKDFKDFDLYECDVAGFEKVLHFRDKQLHVYGIIAIHNSLRGPPLGGCRLIEYPSFEKGLKDVLLLAEAMTYKNAIVDLPYGGGKCVIFKAPSINKHLIFKILSEVLNYLDGAYITTDDVGTTVQDMILLRQFSPYARGIEYQNKQIPATSFGVYQALKAAHFHRTGSSHLKGLRVVVEGLGKTGYALCHFLHQEGCFLYVHDLNMILVNKAIRDFGAKWLNISQENEIIADVFCPCALGESINDALLSRLKVQYIVGSANNQLTNSSIAEYLYRKNIIYVPDYLSNAGGMIDIFCEGDSYCEEFVFNEVRRIYRKTCELLHDSDVLGISPLKLANRMVQKSLESLNLGHYNSGIGSSLTTQVPYEKY